MSAQNQNTITSEPPTYDSAVGGHPPPHRAGNHTDSDSEDEDPLHDVDPETRLSMDDEYRDLPEGWVRAFDQKSMHSFFVEKSTKRAIWCHPYDDPQYLQSLPDSHPAHPNSHQAQAVRKASEDELSRAHAKQQAKQQQQPVKHDEKRSFGGKLKDKLIGTKAEREAEKKRQAKLLRDQQQAYIMRRKALIEQRNDPSLQRYYSSNPYSYAAPSTAYSRRGGMYGSPYGYGYGGGYGRRGYGGMGMGMPLMGGLGGGLLLGSMMGGGMGMGYGGGFGGDCGGGMGGGDMGGGGGDF